MLLHVVCMHVHVNVHVNVMCTYSVYISSNDIIFLLILSPCVSCVSTIFLSMLLETMYRHTCIYTRNNCLTMCSMYMSAKDTILFVYSLTLCQLSVYTVFLSTSLGTRKCLYTLYVHHGY